MFKNLTNPNGCEAQGTFFLLHDYMNYQDVMSLREAGHEMAVSSISDDKSLYLKNYTAWTEELAGMRRLLELQAEIGEEDVLGVPQLLVTRWSGATLSGARCHYHKDDQCSSRRARSDISL